MRAKIRILVIIAVIVAGLITIWSADRTGLFLLKEIEITQQDKIPKSYSQYLLVLQADLDNLKGKNLWSFDLSEVEKILNKYKWVESFNISRKFPKTLLIEVIPKSSVAMLYHPREGLRPITAESELLPTVDPAIAPRVPVLQETKFYKSVDLRKRAVELLKQMPQEGAMKLSELSEVTVDNEKRLWVTHLKTRTLVHLGNDDVQIRSQRVAKVIEYLENHNLSSRVIDADYSKKVLVRLRNGR